MLPVGKVYDLEDLVEVLALHAVSHVEQCIEGLHFVKLYIHYYFSLLFTVYCLPFDVGLLFTVYGLLFDFGLPFTGLVYRLPFTVYRFERQVSSGGMSGDR